MDEELRRVYDHLLIEDFSSAINEANSCVKKYPESKQAHCALIKSFSAAGKDREALERWEDYLVLFPEVAYEDKILEDLAWGILGKGKKASSPQIRLIAYIGAALSQDIQAVHFLREGLSDQNYLLRSICVQLSGMYGDKLLRDAVVDLYKREKVGKVRVAAIQTIGKLKMTDFLPELLRTIDDKGLSAEEKQQAIEAIVALTEGMGVSELRALVASKRAAMRIYACECVATCENREAAPILLPLLNDANPDVMIAAMKAFGLLRIAVDEKQLVKQIASNNPRVGITAGWLLILNRSPQGEALLRRWLTSDNSDASALAAAAIHATGPYGISLAKEYLETTDDPYVTINLALALVSQRVECEKACKIIADALINDKEKWMSKKEAGGLFSAIMKSTATHQSELPNYPDLLNQVVRLELCELLAIMEYPQVKEVLKGFLKYGDWKVTGLAAEILLQEGDESALAYVRELLDDKDRKIRAEAALLLAVWGRDRSAVPLLIENYANGDRMMKLKILESLGRIGDKSTIPFLVKCLHEPTMTLRIAAAAILIQTLHG